MGETRQNMLRSVVLLSLLSAVAGMELTDANWAEKTSGKTLFVKFLAPW